MGEIPYPPPETMDPRNSSVRKGLSKGWAKRQKKSVELTDYSIGIGPSLRDGFTIKPERSTRAPVVTQSTSRAFKGNRKDPRPNNSNIEGLKQWRYSS